MKALFIFLVTVVMFFGKHDLNAQSVGVLFPKEKQDTVRNILKINPILMGRGGNTSLNYERYLGKHLSLIVGASTSKPVSLLRYSNYGNFWEANIGVRKYLNKKKSPLEGLYLSTQLTFSNSFINSSDWIGNRYKENSITAGVNFLIGKQVISRKGMTLDVFTGLGLNYTQGTSFLSGIWGSSSGSYAMPGLNIPAGLRVGFGW